MEITNFNKDKDRKGASARRRPSIDLSTMVYGKVPPQAKDLEEAVLGAVMLEKTAFDTVVEILKSECFYVEAHQRIYKAMQSLQQKNQPIDILTVVEELRSKDELEMVGGPYYVTRLTNAVVSAANIEAHSRIILQKFIQRELIRISGEIIGDATHMKTVPTFSTCWMKQKANYSRSPIITCARISIVSIRCWCKRCSASKTCVTVRKILPGCPVVSPRLIK
jgi:hypothetical protein